MKKIYVVLFLILCFSFRLEAQWTLINEWVGGYRNSLADSDSNLFTTDVFGAGVLRSTDNGKTWERTIVSDSINITAIATNGSNVFASTDDGVWRSTDNGDTWTKVRNGLEKSDVGYHTISCFGFSDSIILGGTYNGGIFRSIDNGDTWTPVNQGLTSWSILSFAVKGSNIFAGTSVGVFLSMNNGTSWTAVNNGLPTNTYVYSLAVSGSNIFAATSAGVYLSSNNGTSWTAANNGFKKHILFNCVAVSDSKIFVATSVGVYLSMNDGTSWTAINYGYIWCIAVNSSYIFATLPELYSMPLSAASEVIEVPTPSVFISPQPVSDEAIVTFNSGNTNAGISIELYDLKGTMVATYNFNSLSEGTNELRFDVSNIPAGMYNAVIKSGAEVHNAKLIKVD